MELKWPWEMTLLSREGCLLQEIGFRLDWKVTMIGWIERLWFAPLAIVSRWKIH